MEITYFKVYKDFIDIARELDNGQRGRLFLAILQYVNGEETENLTGAERIAFVMMKGQIDRDFSALSNSSEARSEAGKKGADARWKNKQNIANDGNAILPLTDDSKNGNNKDKDKDNNKDNNKDKEYIKKEIDKEKSKTLTRFTAPTLEEVKAYCAERNNRVDAERWLDYYTSNGWMVGKNKMRDWKAAVRTWEKNGYSSKPEKPKKETSFDMDLINKRFELGNVK